MRTWIYRFITIIVIAACGFLLFNQSQLQSTLQGVKMEADMHKMYKEAQNKALSQYEEALATWIYKNSSQTSLAMCQEFVRETKGINHQLIYLAIASVESTFNPTAITKKTGSLGVPTGTGAWQINWNAHSKELIKRGIAKDRRDLFNISNGIQAAIYVYEGICLPQEHGDPVRALDCYLGGSDMYYRKSIMENHMRLSMLKK